MRKRFATSWNSTRPLAGTSHTGKMLICTFPLNLRRLGTQWNGRVKPREPLLPLLQVVYLVFQLEAAEIPGKVGWHTLRHTFGTLMKANGEDIKTIQELLQHSNYKVTADTYTQAVTPMKRAAQTKLVKMILLPSKPAGEKQASEE